MMSNDKIIYPTWSSILINLILGATEEWRHKMYYNSWDSMQALYAWMPEECIPDCEKKYIEIDNKLKEIHTKAENYSRDSKIAADYQRVETAKYLYPALLQLSAIVRKTLQDKGYLGKDFGAKPKFEGTGTL